MSEENTNTEPKKKSWAQELDLKKAQETGKPSEEAVELDQYKAVALHLAVVEKTILDLFKVVEEQNAKVITILTSIDGEMTRANAMMQVQIDSAVELPTHKQVQDAIEAEKAAERAEPPRTMGDLTKPDNIKGEDAIIDYYKKQLAPLKTNSSETVTQDILNKLVFKFEQDKIIMNTPYVPTPLFAAIASKVEKELGGHYVKGKGAHFELPYP